MQAAEEVASEIERQIRDASGKVDAFIAAQSLELSRVLHEHEASMRELEGKIVRLRQDHGSVSERSHSLQTQLAQERVKLAERQGEVARLEASAGSLPAEMDTARAKEEAAQRQHAGAKQGASAPLRSVLHPPLARHACAGRARSHSHALHPPILHTRTRTQSWSAWRAR